MCIGLLVLLSDLWFPGFFGLSGSRASKLKNNSAGGDPRVSVLTAAFLPRGGGCIFKYISNIFTGSFRSEKKIEHSMIFLE